MGLETPFCPARQTSQLLRQGCFCDESPQRKSQNDFCADSGHALLNCSSAYFRTRSMDRGSLVVYRNLACGAAPCCDAICMISRSLGSYV